MSEAVVLRLDGGGHFVDDARHLGAPSLEAWLAYAGSGAPNHEGIGDRRPPSAHPPTVHVGPHEDVRTLAAGLPALELVVLEMPKFSDGRAYSQASILRTQLGYRGELRVVGDVPIDQLHFLRRVGVDSAALPAARGTPAALPAIRAALAAFSERYQGAADEALPLFRRRCAGGA